MNKERKEASSPLGWVGDGACNCEKQRGWHCGGGGGGDGWVILFLIHSSEPACWTMSSDSQASFDDFDWLLGWSVIFQ